MYTGGTTGRPKGVLLDHGGQMANAKCTLIDASVEPQDILLTVMPMHHIGGKNFCTVHFHRACTNVLMPCVPGGGRSQGDGRSQNPVRAARADHDQDAAGRVRRRACPRTGAEDRLLFLGAYARPAVAAGDQHFWSNIRPVLRADGVRTERLDATEGRSPTRWHRERAAAARLGRTAASLQ